MADVRLSEAERAEVTQRARYCCEYCVSQLRFSPDPFSVEHITPRSRGGTSDLANLALSCQGCNNFKYTHTQAPDPVSGEVVPLYHPRNDTWQEHFLWSEDESQLVGLTPTGRATISRLHLNREGVVNLRQVLRVLGKHPPDHR